MADESEPERGVPLPLRLGETFYQDAPTFYNIAFDFKPGKIDLEQAGSINIDGASVNVGFQTNNDNPDDFVYYQGAKSDTGGKDAIIVYDPETQEYTLQLVHTHVRLKQIRDTTEMSFPDVSNKTNLHDLQAMKAEGYHDGPRARLTSIGSGLFSDDEAKYRDSPSGQDVQVHDLEDMDEMDDAHQESYQEPTRMDTMDMDNKGGVDPYLSTQDQDSYTDEEEPDAVSQNVDDSIGANTRDALVMITAFVPLCVTPHPLSTLSHACRALQVRQGMLTMVTVNALSEYFRFKDRRRSSEGLDVSSSSGSSSGSDSEGEHLSRKASMTSVNSVKSVQIVTSFREMADAQQQDGSGDGAASAKNSPVHAPESSTAAITHQDSVASNSAGATDAEEIGRRRSSTGLNMNMADLDDGLDLSESDSD
ncbi:hypothetical protein SARC_01858 [Sphaeroforma arctica JP610]|uniref:Transcription elongation factor Eaf N-terminal domain-containing protein n=1 Tax=Sphaeroforma arctica JP610 TaxID=667725 RepID=A0A0L0GAC4_9EUKA|nr:hypothetical protein SARC_01858 [Sphaeroforma arctica JP610]KNC85982.1 hypothetical protein SARC_01858 [Sphaeroforma arctica JP610]|eukprot:XP_014159884.1 hypothetical protein SARC_01858 [Sphaeroforma arctica JP610]